MDNLKFFIVPIKQHATSASPHEGISYQCRVVDVNYKEIFNQVLNEADHDIFIRIMVSDKYALLYRHHEILGDLALLKIDAHDKSPIPDGSKYP